MSKETNEPKYCEQVKMHGDHHLQPMTGRYISQLVSRVVVTAWGILQEQANDVQYTERDAA